MRVYGHNTGLLLSCSRNQLLLVGERLLEDHLAGDRGLGVAQLLDGSVPEEENGTELKPI